MIDVMLQIKNSCLISTIMKPTPFLQEVLHLVINLLNQQGHEQMAESLAQKYQLPPWVQHNNPLLKKGLTKIIKEYVRSNQKMLAYYQDRLQVQQGVKTRKKSFDQTRKQSSSPKIQTKVHKINTKATTPIINKPAEPVPTGRSSWMAKFERPKTLEELNEVKEVQKQEEIVVVPQKKSKGKKKVVESQDYESEEDSFELQPKKKLKKEVKEDKKVAKDKKKNKPKSQSEEQEEQEEVEQKVPTPKKKQETIVKRPQRQYNPYPQADNGPKKSFSRINIDQVGPIREQLKDNSFQAKAKFGQQADSWGKFGYDKLKDTRGDAFKKTKGRLKNRAFQGAMMDINKINSIPIL